MMRRNTHLSLEGDNSLLQETILRLRGLPDMGAPVVVCNEGHRFLVAEQYRNIQVENGCILLEPAARNTACSGQLIPDTFLKEFSYSIGV